MLESDLGGRILLVGIGKTGSKMARQASESAGYDCIFLHYKSSDFGAESIEIPSGGVLNPSMRLLRANALPAVKEAASRARTYDSVIVLAALGEKEGAALAPTVLAACSGMPAASFVTMPFAYQTDRIFESGVALKRVRESCGFTSIVDNEAMRESNPDLSVAECGRIACEAAVYVIGTLAKCDMPGSTSVISCSRPGQRAEESLRDSLKMLYGTCAPGGAGHSILHVSGKSVPVGVLDSMSKLAQDACKSSSLQTDFEGGESGLVMASAVLGKTRFDAYDPLGKIPTVMDWDEPECSIDTGINLRQLE